MGEISGVFLLGKELYHPFRATSIWAAICPSPLGQPLSLHPHFLPSLLTSFFLSHTQHSLYYNLPVFAIVIQTLSRPPLALSHPLFSAHESDCRSIMPIQRLYCPSLFPSKYKLVISRQTAQGGI